MGSVCVLTNTGSVELDRYVCYLILEVVNGIVICVNRYWRWLMGSVCMLTNTGSVKWDRYMC